MINGKKAIAIVGAESGGKSTLAMMLTGRLRTRGVLAAMSQESGSVQLPFHPSFFDESSFGYVYATTNKIASEIRVATKGNVDFIVCDRSPLDFVGYCKAKHGEDSPFYQNLKSLAVEWSQQYDHVYVIPSYPSNYVEDGFRASAKDNYWRDSAGQAIQDLVFECVPDKATVVAAESFRHRAEYVYHHVLDTFFGESRPVRAYDQIRDWLRDQGFDIVEGTPQGSNSLVRFHAPTDHDDIDAICIVRGGVEYAQKVRASFVESQEHLENVVQANIDLLVTPEGMEAHEL